MRNATASQEYEIHQHLAAGGSITPTEALDMFGCFRLAARVHGLRQQGLPIVGSWEQGQNGKRWMRYALEGQGVGA